MRNVVQKNYVFFCLENIFQNKTKKNESCRCLIEPLTRCRGNKKQLLITSVVSNVHLFICLSVVVADDDEEEEEEEEEEKEEEEKEEE